MTKKAPITKADCKNGFILPETPTMNNGFKKGVTTENIDVSDSPDNEYNLNIIVRGYCRVTVMVVDKTAEEISRQHDYNHMMGRHPSGYIFED